MQTKTILICLFIFKSLIGSGQTQTLNYDLSVAGNSIGMLTAVKTVSKNTITYTANSLATVHLFGETQISTSLTVVSMDGILQSSHYKIEKNGTLNDESTTILKNGVYYINHNGKTSQINTPIKFSTTMLYFDEPKKVSSVFAELEGINKDFVNLGSSTYQLTDPSNHHTNSYTYENGILKEALISHTLFNFKLSLKK
ncbi:MAG: hypothetical protein CMC14_09055 [Flavobacteriaceae bacterium]|nr:hypothetical protein [Flavobacteriaceae bacterium]|tara:strand:- start:846 stop:1439 length:594 start_codon:yes stop_codon:yes gene_type:complete